MVPSDDASETRPVPSDCAPVSSDDPAAEIAEPSCDAQSPNPAKLVGGTSNGVNVEATDVAPT
jgi:hypothetical protein